MGVCFKNDLMSYLQGTNEPEIYWLLADRTSRRVGERPQVGGTCVSPMAWPHCQREV